MTAFANVLQEAFDNTTTMTTRTTTATFTPAAATVYFATVVTEGGAVVDATPTLSGAGITWVEVLTLRAESEASTISVLRGIGPGSNGALTFTRSGSTFQTCSVLVDAVTDADTSGTNGSGAVAQVVNALYSFDAPTATPSAAITMESASNALYCVASAWSGRYTSTPATGWTELADIGIATQVALSSNYRTTADTACGVTWSGVTKTAVIGIEVQDAAAGPTIDTQPVADTVLINGDAARASASFTVAATGTGTLSYQWELETSVGGGVYANVADGSGATWEGATTTNLTATFTVKTLTGRRVRCVVTDDNGSTTSSAVALTVYTGPVLSKSSGTTNASGVDTLTITSDYPNADGEFTVVTATAGGVTKQVALHYETPP